MQENPNDKIIITGKKDSSQLTNYEKNFININQIIQDIIIENVKLDLMEPKKHVWII